jgi:hypothetical protein
MEGARPEHRYDAHVLHPVLGPEDALGQPWPLSPLEKRWQELAQEADEYLVCVDSATRVGKRNLFPAVVCHGASLPVTFDQKQECRGSMRRSPSMQDSPVKGPRRSADEFASDGDCGDRRPAEVSESTGVERPAGTEAAGVRQARPGHLHIALAGRALFAAIKADVTAFGRHLALLPGSATRRRSETTQGGKRTRSRDEGLVPRRRAVLVPLIKGIAVAALEQGRPLAAFLRDRQPSAGSRNGAVRADPD